MHSGTWALRYSFIDGQLAQEDHDKASLVDAHSLCCSLHHVNCTLSLRWRSRAVVCFDPVFIPTLLVEIFTVSGSLLLGTLASWHAHVEPCQLVSR